MDKNRWVLLYSSLLHDVGKFIQRGRMETSFLEHQQAATEFIENAIFPQCLMELKASIKNLVGSHHHPNESCLQPDEKLKDLLETLQKADELSEKWRQPIDDMNSISSTPLLSIFHEVQLNGQKPSCIDRLYFDVREITLDNNVIPKPINEVQQPLSQAYKKLLEKFECELKLASKIDNIEAYFLTLYHLLLKCTFFIPSVTKNHEPIISLFEHLSTTSALANSLYQPDKKGEEKILIIGGDVCRIQSFVYTITSEQAAKMLRGRAFFVHLINKTITHYILRKLGLEIPNIIWCGGGNFTIIAPHSEEKIRLLEEAIKEINSFLLKKFDGELQIAIGFITVKPQELQNFGALLSRLSQKLEETKHKQFIELLPDAYKDVFGPKTARTNGVCSVCKKPAVTLKKTDELKVCENCKSLENIGAELAKSQYLLMLAYDPANPINIDNYKENAQNFEGLGFGYILASNKEKLKAILMELQSSHIRMANVISLNSTEFLDDELMREYDIPVTFSFDFIGKYVPLNEREQAKSFDDIVKGQQGANYLGVLRMDVDLLGKIFFKGLGPEASISRISTMSRLLSIFFDGYLSWYIGDKFRDKVYMVYSGGDDLFFIGRWDVICDLSKEIQEGFSKVASKNPQVTISAGIILADSKWPVYRLAEASNHLLHQSKKRGRNRITMFSSKEDYTVTWEELETLTKLKNNLLKMVTVKVISKGFLFHLRNIHKEYEREKSEYQNTNKKPQRYKWLLRYIIARQIRQHPNLTEELLNLEGEIQNCIENLDIPIIWADLQSRTPKSRG